MDKELISIIIPIYNVEKYLRKCVDSVLAQTYKNLEVILVDDGSPDNCPAICDEYAEKDNRIKVIHKENGGQGSARNRGIDIAKGEYMAFVDSDDYIEPEMYEVMIDALERTDSDISFCGFLTHSGLRVVESTGYKEEHIFENTEQLLEGLFTGNAVGNPWNKVCKRVLFDSLRFPEDVAREDIYIAHELYGKCNRAVHTGKFLYHYIIREGSSEHQEFSPKYLISIKIADRRRDYIAAKFPNLLPYAEKSCYGSRISAIKKIVRSNAEKANTQTLKELKRYVREHKPCDKEQKRLRRKILYFPMIYKIKLFFKYRFRNSVKKIILKFKKSN